MSYSNGWFRHLEALLDSDDTDREDLSQHVVENIYILLEKKKRGFVLFIQAAKPYTT